MAVFGKSLRDSRGGSGGRSSKQGRHSSNRRSAQQNVSARQNASRSASQMDARLPRVDSNNNVDMRRNTSRQAAVSQTGQVRKPRSKRGANPGASTAMQPLGTADMGAANEAIGSYADLAPVEGTNQKLGPVVISLRNVTKVYPAQPNHPALSGISLDIHSGEFLFLVGHSGSGKSTFIRMLNREIVPSGGELMVAGENLRTIKSWRIPYLRRNVGCVFQDFKLLPNKTAFENVAFALEVIGKSRHVINTQVPEVLRLVGLEAKMDQLPDQLSGGEQQRVSIARSIVNRPPILICDEPTGNLDPQTSLGIMRLLERINRTGTTILVATHDREMVDQMRRRVLALENGILVRDQKKGVYGYDV